MHGLINRAIERFTRDTYNSDTWEQVVRHLALDFDEFEAMLSYETRLTHELISSLCAGLGKPRNVLLEDIGTYLVSHKKTEPLRRLLRFGGVTFVDFLHSLDDLRDRARLAVADLDLPVLELWDHGTGHFSLSCDSPHDGFGHVLMGVLRAMADDYGALVFLEHKGRNGCRDRIEIRLIESAFSEGRHFDLGAGLRV